MANNRKFCTLRCFGTLCFILLFLSGALTTVYFLCIRTEYKEYDGGSEQIAGFAEAWMFQMPLNLIDGKMNYSEDGNRIFHYHMDNNNLLKELIEKTNISNNEGNIFL